MIQKILDGTAKSVPLKGFGLKSRGEVYLSQKYYVRLIDRKSRFLRKDAETFLKEFEQVQEHEGRSWTPALLVKQAPMCSKAQAWLEEQHGFVMTLP